MTCYLPVPPGTEVRDAETAEILGELVKPDATLLCRQGGRGGRWQSALRDAERINRARWERENKGKRGASSWS